MERLEKKLRFDQNDPQPVQKVSRQFFDEFADVFRNQVRENGPSIEKVVKKYLVKFSDLFAKRENDYNNYLTGWGKIQEKISEKFKKRQKVAREQRRTKRKKLAEEAQSKRKEIRRLFRVKINKIEKARDQFNAEYKALNQPMSDYGAKVKNLNRCVFSFDEDADPYYDFYDEFLAQSITSCLKKYRSMLQGFEYKRERELLTELRAFRDNMLKWKTREDELKKLYGNPFSPGKEKTNESFRGKLLEVVKKNEFAKALFNWTCRLKQSGKDYFYKGFTWGATFFEARTGKNLSPLTHYLKCRDIIYSIKEYLRHEGDHVSDVVKLVLLKEAKMCEIARECFYKKRPDEADAMDYWWEGNPYTIDFKN